MTLFIEIAGQDAACETIDMDHPTGTFLKLVIKGQTLTLGDASTDTTSVIDGEFVFEEVASNPGKLEVHNWVTFSVPVNGFCTFTAKEPAEFIRASSDGVGVEFAEGSGTLDVSGQFQFLVSVKHDATFFGVTKGVMSFGLLNGAAFNPVLQISGTSLNAKEFVAQTGGRMEFHEVDFASTAPSWLVSGVNSEIRVTATLNNVPNDIEIDFNALLNLRDNFTCNGQLTHQTGTIRVKAGKHASIESGV